MSTTAETALPEAPPTTGATPSTTSRRAGGSAVAVVLSLLTVFGPISMYLYLPVLPALTRDLGAASSFLGVARFAFGGLAAPLVGLGSGAVPLGLVTVGGAALAALAYVVAVRGRDAVPLPQH